MSMLSIDIGISDVSVTDVYTFFADTYDPTKKVKVHLGSVPLALVAGQVVGEIIAGVDSQLPITTKEAFVALQAATKKAYVLLDAIAVNAGEVYAAAIPEGCFIQQKLVPADIPVGAHNFGTIIIEKEVK